jgi:hypothetical protein
MKLSLVVDGFGLRFDTMLLVDEEITSFKGRNDNMVLHG